MALTPEDVVNKRFNPTKFREGYDQDEVDDFLDEVVVELRRLNQENEELRQRLMAADARINELQAGGAVAPVAAPAPMPVAAPEPAFAPQVTGDPSDPANTNHRLQLARRLPHLPATRALPRATEPPANDREQPKQRLSARALLLLALIAAAVYGADQAAKYLITENL